MLDTTFSQLPYYQQWSIYLFFLGSCASLLGSLVGFGGGIFVIPILLLVFKIPLNFAVGSMTICLLASSTLNTIINVKRQTINYPIGIAMEIPTVLGSIFGTFLLKFLPVNYLAIGFSLLLMRISFSMISSNFKKGENEDSPSKLSKIFNNYPPFITFNHPKNLNLKLKISYWLVGFYGGLAGIIAGLFGVGGGLIKTPIMIKIFNLPAKNAVATSLFMIMFTSLTAFIGHFKLGNVVWEISLPLASGFLSGAIIASFLQKITDKKLELIIGCTIILAALIIMLNSILKILKY